MKALRIKLKQPSASYTVPEMVNNKMTYPLPSFSTVIGALHNACGYKEYHEMKVSVQGKYSSVQKEVYVNHGLIDTVHDDRGNLIWLHDPNALNAGYILVGKALNATNNSFKNGITISVAHEEKISLYRELLQKEEEFKEISKGIKIKKSEVKEKEKKHKEKYGKDGKGREGFEESLEEVRAAKEEVKRLEAEHKERKYREVEEPKSHFKTLTKGPQSWEVLYDVELILHIAASEEVLNDILNNRNNFVSLGRSEDFVEITEMKIVEITEEIDDEYGMEDEYLIYADLQKIENRTYMKESRGKKILGTVYHVSKEYRTEDGARIFNKIPCVCTSGIKVDSASSNGGVFIDKEGEKTYIVDLI